MTEKLLTVMLNQSCCLILEHVSTELQNRLTVLVNIRGLPVVKLKAIHVGLYTTTSNNVFVQPHFHVNYSL